MTLNFGAFTAGVYAYHLFFSAFEALGLWGAFFFAGEADKAGNQ